MTDRETTDPAPATRTTPSTPATPPASIRSRLSRRLVLLGGAATAAGSLYPLATATPAAAGGRPGSRSGGRQVAFLNHTYTVLDAATAEAVATDDFLHAFGFFQLRTTTNAQLTYSGRYLLGRQTYLEMFTEGELPAPDDRRGASGLALSPDRAGLIDTVRARMIALGVADPIDVIQTKQLDGDAVPWFRLVTPTAGNTAVAPWVMEYLESYFADPRTDSEPASGPGDVSRERYDSDEYRRHLMRDVVEVELVLPADDLPAVVTTLRASGLRVHTRGTRTVAVGRSETVVLRTGTRAEIGWRRIVFALNRPVRRRRVERIGRSRLVVGPGRQAVWSFD